ncbi:bifunctional pyr operon transcriptional regulator/uracil phosphoribosyltransferase PyrR [Candidatus Xianfuyuplasma coldseepsis]|nr:bifunctional pyr operon transcriptional regulator/uracil phosphoribosyltransferase PyrR [Xianfuyuplasma coldseepsis]
MRKLIEEDKMIRTIRRISHEIIERNNNLDDVVLVGILRNGVPLAEAIQENIQAIEEVEIPVYSLDISGYRDDVKNENFTKLDVNLTGNVVIIVDDVLYTGRTARASMDAIIDLGRPAKIQLAVLIDRGHRELPIRADYVGKNMPTSASEKVRVEFHEQPGVYIYQLEESPNE